jgi:ribonuclease P protein component
MAQGAHPAPPLRRLVKRGEFLRAARGLRAGRPSVSLQAAASQSDVPGIGLTVTKRVGNAPERNRIKRRLRAAVRTCASAFRPRHDYVLVGRRDALSTPFAALVADVEQLLARIHHTKAGGPRTAAPGAPDIQRQ